MISSANSELNLEAVPLQKAVLCVNCNNISDSPHDTCAVCGSRSLLNLSSILDRSAELAVPRAAALSAEASAVVQTPPFGTSEASETSETSETCFVLTCPNSHKVRRRRRIGHE